MEALIGSCSSSSFLKLKCCTDNKIGFLFPKSPLHHSPINRKNNKNNDIDVDFKLSISVSSTRRSVRPVSLSSSHTQTDFENHELLIEESTNGHTIEAETETETVRVKFLLLRECSFGQNFLITGDNQIFGFWDPNNAIPLTWSDGHLWTVDLDIPTGKCIKFKFIMQEIDGKYTWQPGPDRVLECFKTKKIINLYEDWENPDLRQLIETGPTSDQEIQMVAANEEKPIEPLVSVNGTKEPKEYAINMKQMLVSDEVVPVLVPGLSQHQNGSVKEDEAEPVNEVVPVLVPGLSQHQDGSVKEDEHEPVNEVVPVLVPTLSQHQDSLVKGNEPEPVNGGVMVSARADMANDLNLPELDSKEDANISNLNPRSIHENQDSCENEHQDSYEHEHQEMQVGDKEQDHEVTQPMESLILNKNQWGNNIMQKLLSIFRVQ